MVLNQKKIDEMKKSFQQYTLAEICKISRGKNIYFSSTNRRNSYFETNTHKMPEGFFWNTKGEIISGGRAKFDLHESGWSNWIIFTKEFIDLMIETRIHESQVNMEKRFRKSKGFLSWFR